jgi:hypothetical protein
MPLRALAGFERKLERQLRFIELKRGAIGRRIGWRLRDFEKKNLKRDELRFFRSLSQKSPTSRSLAGIVLMVKSSRSTPRWTSSHASGADTPAKSDARAL